MKAICIGIWYSIKWRKMAKIDRKHQNSIFINIICSIKGKINMPMLSLRGRKMKFYFVILQSIVQTSYARWRSSSDLVLAFIQFFIFSEMDFWEHWRNSHKRQLTRVMMVWIFLTPFMEYHENAIQLISIITEI